MELSRCFRLVRGPSQYRACPSEARDRNASREYIRLWIFPVGECASTRRSAQARAAPVLSPEILPDHRVTFRIAAAPDLSSWHLRDAGHDVVAIAEVAKGATDEQVLERAVNEKRVLITEDRDFGELVYARGRSSAGVIPDQVSQPRSSGQACDGGRGGDETRRAPAKCVLPLWSQDECA